MSTPRRVGVYGGSFDPPHVAHVAVARAAVEQLALDELHVLPTGDAWHKSHATSPAAPRLAMARIAFGGLPGVVVDDREVRRHGPTYTIDTLRELAAEQPGATLFLVMGEDQAIALTRWREWEEVLRLADIAVVGRPQAQSHSNLGGPGVPAQARVHRLQLPSMEASATELRRRTACGEDISHLVPPGVASYIAAHSLYRSC